MCRNMPTVWNTGFVTMFIIMKWTTVQGMRIMGRDDP